MDSDTIAMLSTYGPLVVMVLIFYFLLYRPHKKEQARRQDMLDSLKKGSKVMTIGGIYGDISEIKEKTIKLKIAANVEIEVARSAINASVVQEKKD